MQLFFTIILLFDMDNITTNIAIVVLMSISEAPVSRLA